MKRYLTILSCLFFSSVTLLAQKGQPGFGKIDKADLLMTECDFDKGAEAVKLIDWGNLYYDRGNAGFSFFKTIYERRVRIKILQEKGLSHANIQIPFYSRDGGEKIVNFDANTYNLDETGNVKTTDVKKSSIYTKKINSDFSEMIIAFPEVKAGSIIEYRYRMERDADGDIKDWAFQDRIPTRYSEYEVKIPLIFRFSAQPSVVDKMDVKEEVIQEMIGVNEGVVSTNVLHKKFIMQNLIGIRDEPFMGSPNDYQQRIDFQLSQIDFGNGNVKDYKLKWSNVIDELNKRSDFGKQLEKELPQTQPIIAEAKKLTDAESKISFLYNTVRKNVNWNNDEDIYADNGITKTWETKNGNAADINLLLVKLLTDAGIKALPILVSTREHGLVNSYYPFVQQFNVVMAYVNLNGRHLVLDATDKISNYKLTPEKIVNTNGFLVEGLNGRWVALIDSKHKYKVMAATQAVITNDGSLKGEALVNCNDYARKKRVEVYVKDKEKFKTDYFSLPGTASVIDDFSVNNINVDSLPLEQKVKFTTKLNNSGDYHYFNINIFSDLTKNPFIEDERVSDVDFGFQQEYIIYGNYTLPEEYTFDGLPENVSMIMPDTSIIFSRTMQVDNNLLNVRISVEFLNTFYPASAYPEFKEFYKKLFAALNEQIVIKKKS